MASIKSFALSAATIAVGIMLAQIAMAKIVPASLKA